MLLMAAAGTGCQQGALKVVPGCRRPVPARGHAAHYQPACSGVQGMHHAAGLVACKWAC